MGPAVQASYMKNVFAALEKQGRLPALASEAPQLVRAVEAASRMTWLEVELNVRMVEAMAARFGAEPGLQILAGCVHAQFETPLWKGFIGAALRLLGTDPGSLGRWIPRPWGSCSVTAEAGRRSRARRQSSRCAWRSYRCPSHAIACGCARSRSA
ncbi:MAG: hypothetical protein ACREI8_00955 [Myxococcota bacterium]